MEQKSKYKSKMKKLILKGSILVFLACMGASDMFAQQFESEEDSLDCLRNYSLYYEYYRQGDYERAFPYWETVYEEYPFFRRSVFIHGERMLDAKLEELEEDKEEHEKLLEEAMRLFDRRIEYHGDEANVLGRKGRFYFRHNNVIEEAGPGYQALEEALEAGNRSAPVMVLYMNVTVGKFHADLLDNEDVINTYVHLSDLINEAIEETDNDDLFEAKDVVEDLFADSNAADCDALIDIFGERVEESPEDKELISRVHDLLDEAGCTEEDLYYYTTERLYEMDPSASSAMNLARMHRAIDELETTREYLKEAIELEEDSSNRSRYYLELAELVNNLEDDPELVREYARNAIEDDESNGQAYMLIGHLYTEATDCFEDEFEQETVYWAAVDKFIEAKEADPELEERANEFIEAYEARFPDQETLFFHDFEIGESYTVGCWINETTTVRAR